MPGRFVTDRNYDDYMKLRRNYNQGKAAAKAGFSPNTGSRIDRHLRPPFGKIGEQPLWAAANLACYFVPQALAGDMAHVNTKLWPCTGDCVVGG